MVISLNVTYNSTSGLYKDILNLTNGSYDLIVTAVDSSNAFGTAIVSFVVHTHAKVVKVPVNNETNIPLGVVGGSANVTAENNMVLPTSRLQRILSRFRFRLSTTCPQLLSTQRLFRALSAETAT